MSLALRSTVAWRRTSWWLGTAILVATLLAEGKASAEPPPPRPAVVLPVRGDADIDHLSLERLLEESAVDLGLAPDEPPEAIERQEALLPGQAAELGRIVVVPTLRERDDRIEIRIVVAYPDSEVLQSRVVRVAPDDVEVRAVVMLRDIIRQGEPTSVELRKPEVAPAAVEPRGGGRATLAVNGTLYGGFLGYSLQRASGSDDPRLLYPLIAVGAGVGLGSAIILADEFAITSAQAWYLAAGAWWPGVGGHLIYEGRFGDTPSADGDEAWAFGLMSSVSGVTLATVGLTGARNMDAGGAVLTHSGGALGTIVGGLSELAVVGDPEQVPFAGMGYGAISGWLLASSAAVVLPVEAGNVLAVDLGVLLGGLAGAAAASPLLIDDVTKTKTRGWVAATGGGLIAGGVVAGLLFWGDEEDAVAESWRWAVPRVGRVGQAPSLGEVDQRGWGLSWAGTLR